MCYFVSGGLCLLLLLLLLLALLIPKPTTTTTRPALPYDCKEGVATWKAYWPIDKKNWCCANARIGCAEPVVPTLPPPPPPPTTALPYDCSAGVANWATGWSDAKKAWCCARGGQGCATPAKMCTLWGDPHIISFDQIGTDKNQALSFYGDGDFW